MEWLNDIRYVILLTSSSFFYLRFQVFHCVDESSELVQFSHLPTRLLRPENYKNDTKNKNLSMSTFYYLFSTKSPNSDLLIAILKQVKQRKKGKLSLRMGHHWKSLIKSNHLKLQIQFKMATRMLRRKRGTKMDHLFVQVWRKWSSNW